MNAATFLQYLLTFLAGIITGGAGVYLLLRGFLLGVGRAMPFRSDEAPAWRGGLNGR
jgi:hypothetical protein